MRGKVSSDDEVELFVGITPAHAGKRLFLYKIYKNHQDHPRTCGEKIFCHDFSRLCPGSPPHMRGKGWLIFVDDIFDGITPAHAGKSLLQDLFKLCN